VRISESWYFLSGIVVVSVLPAIINAKKIDQKLYYDRLQKLYDFSVWIAILVAVCISFSSEYIINILYGKEYYKSSSVLIIHVWTGVFIFIGLVFSRYLLIENQTQKSLYRTSLGVIFNIILNLILIPIYGIDGAAIATLLSQFIVNYLYDFFDKDVHSRLMLKTKSFFSIHILKGYK